MLKAKVKQAELFDINHIHSLGKFNNDQNGFVA